MNVILRDPETEVGSHRKIGIPFPQAPRGVCRFCRQRIIPDGKPNRRLNWHPECVDAYMISPPVSAAIRNPFSIRPIALEQGKDLMAFVSVTMGLHSVAAKTALICHTISTPTPRRVRCARKRDESGCGRCALRSGSCSAR